MRQFLFRACSRLAVGLVALAIAAAAMPANAQSGAPRSGIVLVENAGQFPPAARFVLLRGPGQTVFADDAIWLTVAEPKATDPARLHGARIRIRFAGADAPGQWVASGARPTSISYFTGADPRQWRPDVPVWSRLEYRGLPGGASLVFGEGPDAAWPWQLRNISPDSIAGTRLLIEGAERVTLEDGRLVLSTPAGDVRLPLIGLPPGASATAGPTVLPAGPGAFVVAAPFASAESPAAGSSDLLYATFLGGAEAEYAWATAAAADGGILIAGETQSPSFPNTPGSFDDELNNQDAFLLKLDPAGNGSGDLVFATFLGGSFLDAAYALSVDASGNIFLAGNTQSTDFPVTGGAYDKTCGTDGACNRETDGTLYTDAFLARFDANGASLQYATYLGGSDNDVARGVAADSGGYALLTGDTTSATGFPLKHAYDETCGSDGLCDLSGGVPYSDAFLLRLKPANTGAGDLLYGTYLGGNDDDRGYGVAHAGGQAYIAGDSYATDFPPGAANAGASDALLARIDPAKTGGASLVWARLLGGSAIDSARAIAVDAANNTFITGETRSTNFPAGNAYGGGQADAFLARYDGAGSRTFTTFIGGSDRELAYSLGLTPSGAAVVAGFTRSLNFPTTAGGYDITHNGERDIFVYVRDPGQSAPLYSTYLGGSADDEPYGVSVDAQGRATLAGYTKSADFPTTIGAYDPTYNQGLRDAALAQLATLPAAPVAPQVSISASGNDAVLSWQPVIKDVLGRDLVVSKYQVWRSPSPYFAPGGAPDAEVLAPSTMFTDSGALAGPAGSSYYIVRAVSEAGLSSTDSNRTGEFGFTLAKGS